MTDKKKQYYLAEFEKIRQGKLSWNWCCALLPSTWAAYRKVNTFPLVMYVMLCCVSILCVAIAGILSMILNTTYTDIIERYSIAYDIINIVMAIIIGGLYGNKLFLLQLKTRIRKGYTINKHYSPTSRCLALCDLFFLITSTLLCVAGIYVKMLITIAPILMLAGYLILAIIWIYIWHQDERNTDKAMDSAEQLPDTSITDENLMKLM